jgi:pimeloyl-ACP methyl ester carboxylesterase
MSNYQNLWFKSREGLKLYARDYVCPEPEATIVCIPGLTRNSADFEALCEHLSKRFRVLAVDLRGRGLSEYDTDPNNYNPVVYTGDMISLLDFLNLESVVLIGTSLGGLVSMLLAAQYPGRVAGVVMNDIGPEANPEGISRIRSYVCNRKEVSTWDDAIAVTRAIQGREFPDFSDEDWARFARNIYAEGSSGAPVLRYDPAISNLLEEDQENAVPPDLWPVFGLMKDLPLLVVRGELSDILLSEVAGKMQSVLPHMHLCEVPNRGHTPLLNEDISLQFIDRFLAQVLAAQAVEAH